MNFSLIINLKSDAQLSEMKTAALKVHKVLAVELQKPVMFRRWVRLS